MSSFFRVRGNRVKIIFQYIFFTEIRFSGHVYEIFVPYIHIFFLFQQITAYPWSCYTCCIYLALYPTMMAAVQKLRCLHIIIIYSSEKVILKTYIEFPT